MLKKYIALTGVAFLTTASLSFAADTAGNLSNAEKNKVTIGNEADTTYFEFQTSPQVRMDGDSTEQDFVVGAVHTSVLGKKGGMAYAMSSETSGLYSKSVSGENGDLGEVKFTGATDTAGAGIDGYKVEGSAQ